MFHNTSNRSRTCFSRCIDMLCKIFTQMETGHLGKCIILYMLSFFSVVQLKTIFVIHNIVLKGEMCASHTMLFDTHTHLHPQTRQNQMLCMSTDSPQSDLDLFCESWPTDNPAMLSLWSSLPPSSSCSEISRKWNTSVSGNAILTNGL